MTNIQQIKLGLQGYSVAFKLIFKNGFLKYMIFPFLLNIIIFWIGTSFIIDMADKAQEALINLINLEQATFWGSEFLNSALSGLVKTLIYIAFIITFVYIGGYIIIIIMAPVFSLISEKTEITTTTNNDDFPFNFKQFIKDIFRGVGIAIRNMSIELGIMVVVIIVGFVPIIGWFGPIVMFFISAYFFGFSYMDYTNERHKRSMKESIYFIRKYKWVAITNGAIFSFSLIIPYCGIALSAFIAILSVIAGTVSTIELNKYENSISELQ